MEMKGKVSRKVVLREGSVVNFHGNEHLIPILRFLFVKPFPSYFHGNENLIPILRPLFVKPFPLCFHGNEPLTPS